jgi:tetratricopeptide (TPR) repeat protein
MSKKSKRVKRLQRRPVQPQAQMLKQLVSHAQHQMIQGDFAGAISTCEPLREFLPQRSPMRVEVLALLGLAHGVLQHGQESYDLLTEALTIEPTNAELWYNRGLACQCLTRIGQSVRDFERAVELLKHDTGEMAHRSAEALAQSRQCVTEAMQAYGEQITLDQYIERETLFMRAMQLTKKNQWHEAERIYRQLIAMGGPLPQYWGNLGVSLVMQRRYDEAEAAFKRALDIDPQYPVARDNLMKLPELRRLGPSTVEVINLSPEQDVAQKITFFEPNDDHSSLVAHTTIEKSGNTVKGTRTQLGLQSPRYRFFLNPYQDTRFTTCPQCRGKTRQRKLSLVIHADPMETLLWDKLCRYCVNCDLLIVHQDQLEQQLVGYFTKQNPKIIGNDYLVLGTLEKPESRQGLPDPFPLEEMIERLHDFKETVSFT